MKFIKTFETFNLEEPRTMTELLEKLSVVEQSILDSIGAELINIDHFLNNDFKLDSIEELDSNTEFINLLKLKGLRKDVVQHTDDYETFLLSPFKYLLLRNKIKNDLQDPDFIFIQTFNSTQQKWNSIKLYKINGDFKNFYDKLTNRTIEIEDNGSKYMYQTSNKNEFELVNQEETAKFPRFVRKEDLLRLMNSESIQEGYRTGNYYHFVDIDILQYLMKNDFVFRLNDNDINPDKYLFGLSLTRKFDFAWSNFRITFDSDKLNTKFKIQPFHYFNTSDRLDFDFKGDHRYPYDENGTYSGNEPHFDNQYEERIVTNKQFLNLKDYIIQIDILNHDRDVMDYNTVYDLEEVKKLITQFKKMYDININLVDSFSPIK